MCYKTVRKTFQFLSSEEVKIDYKLISDSNFQQLINTNALTVKQCMSFVPPPLNFYMYSTVRKRGNVSDVKLCYTSLTS